MMSSTSANVENRKSNRTSSTLSPSHSEINAVHLAAAGRGCDLTFVESQLCSAGLVFCMLSEHLIPLTSPSSNPSPVVAQLGTTYHIRSFNWPSLSFSVTSVGVIEPGMSCLLAKTSRSASFISRSSMILCSSCLASSIRARSFESTTKIRPCVPEK